MKKLLVLGCVCLLVLGLTSMGFAFDEEENEIAKRHREWLERVMLPAGETGPLFTPQPEIGEVIDPGSIKPLPDNKYKPRKDEPRIPGPLAPDKFETQPEESRDPGSITQLPKYKRRKDEPYIPGPGGYLPRDKFETQPEEARDPELIKPLPDKYKPRKDEPYIPGPGGALAPDDIIYKGPANVRSGGNNVIPGDGLEMIDVPKLYENRSGATLTVRYTFSAQMADEPAATDMVSLQ